jgi:hypothetical protein
LLTDGQIDRYSRQIILPEVGGIGQERLLAARVTVLAEIDDLSPALEYLAGAGLGTIRLDSPADSVDLGRAIATVAELNPDVRIEAGVVQAERDLTLLVLAGSNRVIEAARQVNRNAGYRRMIMARFGEPYLIAVLTSRPPCLACAGTRILAPIERGQFAVATAMAAAAETIKCLLASVPESSRLIEFSGHESRSIQLEARKGCPQCR